MLWLLVRSLKSKSDEQKRMTLAAMAASARLSDVKEVIALLEVKEDSLNLMAAEALATSSSNIAIQPLVGKLRHESREMRERAAQSLKALNWQPDSIKRRLDFYLGLCDWERAAEVGEFARHLLIAALDRPGVDEKAAEAVASFGGLAVEPLLQAVQGADVSHQDTIILALGMIGDTRALEPLRALAERNSRASDAITKIEEADAHRGTDTDGNDPSELEGRFAPRMSDRDGSPRSEAPAVAAAAAAWDEEREMAEADVMREIVERRIAAAAVPAEPSQPAFIHVVCICGEQAMVPITFAGRTGKCRSCNATVTAPDIRTVVRV